MQAMNEIKLTHLEDKEIPSHPTIKAWGRVAVTIFLEDYGTSAEAVKSSLDRAIKDLIGFQEAERGSDMYAAMIQNALESPGKAIKFRDVLGI
jgi:hypothetical protein